jgi:hypothetical protein
MMTSKDGTARIEIKQHNAISMAMEDLPEAEGGTQEGALGGDGCRMEEEAHVFLENTDRGDQEGRPNCHDYRDYCYNIHGNS